MMNIQKKVVFVVFTVGAILIKSSTVSAGLLRPDTCNVFVEGRVTNQHGNSPSAYVIGFDIYRGEGTDGTWMGGGHGVAYHPTYSTGRLPMSYRGRFYQWSGCEATIEASVNINGRLLKQRARTNGGGQTHVFVFQDFREPITPTYTDTIVEAIKTTLGSVSIFR